MEGWRRKGGKGRKGGRRRRNGGIPSNKRGEGWKYEERRTREEEG